MAFVSLIDVGRNVAQCHDNDTQKKTITHKVDRPVHCRTVVALKATRQHCFTLALAHRSHDARPSGPVPLARRVRTRGRVRWRQARRAVLIAQFRAAFVLRSIARHSSLVESIAQNGIS